MLPAPGAAHPFPGAPEGSPGASDGTAFAAEGLVLPGDSADLRSEARRAQRRFERTRVHYAQWNIGSSTSMRCDEHVGRFCLRHGRGSDWEPPEEAEEIHEARDELLEDLASIAREIPGDDWVLGQRVRYLGEAERWEEAEELARTCGGASEWWCRALLGYVLHHEEDFPGAAEAFRGALDQMDPEQAREWADPRMLADRDGAALLAEAEDGERERLEERFWTLANPLFLVEGNDRRTAHFARHVASVMGENARNPHGIRWSDDLTEITVRYGPTVAWEKDRRRPGYLGPTPVVGRRNPRSRGFVPSGDHLAEPSVIPKGEWTTDDPATEEQYAPLYAPRIEGLDPQVAVFPRGDSMTVVAAWEVPEWVEYEGADPEPPPEGPFHAGLFLLPLNGDGTVDGESDASVGASTGREVREPFAVTRREAEEGEVLRLDVPVDDYLLSLEALHDDEEKAWRARHGLAFDPADASGIALSELLLVRPGREGEGESLDELLPYALPGTDVEAGSAVGIVWEITGLEGLSGRLGLSLTLEETDRGTLRRVAERLRLTSPDSPTVLGWSEPIPDGTGSILRAVDVDLGGVEPGTYELRLEVEAPDGETRTFERTLNVVEGG